MLISWNENKINNLIQAIYLFHYLLMLVFIYLLYKVILLCKQMRFILYANYVE